MLDLSNDSAPTWAATHPRTRRRILLCSFHLTRELVFTDAAPADPALCAICTEAVIPSRHAIARWIERVKPGTSESAGRAIIEFVADAYTADSPPRWTHLTLPDGVEVLVNDRRPDVALLKRRRRDGLAVVVTVLTPDFEKRELYRTANVAKL